MLGLGFSRPIRGTETWLPKYGVIELKASLSKYRQKRILPVLNNSPINNNDNNKNEFV